MSIFNINKQMAQDFLSKENYYFSQTPTVAPGDRLVRVAHEKWGPDYNVYRPNFRAIGLAYAIKGQALFETNDQKWDISKGSVIAFGPGPSYSVSCDKKNPLEIMIVTFCGMAQINLAKDCLGGTCLAIHPNNSHEIFSLYEQLLNTAKEQRHYSEEICNTLIASLLWTIKRGLAESNSEQTPSMAKFIKCKQFIDNNFLKIKTITEITRQNNTSHVHLCRLFKLYAKTTPNLYLLKLKTNHAAHLLQFTALPIKKIAGDLGFSDQYVFSKTFKRLTGHSPLNFRNSC